MPEGQTAGADESTTEAVVPVPSSPIHVRNIAFTLLSVAIVILLLQFMQTIRTESLSVNVAGESGRLLATSWVTHHVLSTSSR